MRFNIVVVDVGALMFVNMSFFFFLINFTVRTVVCALESLETLDAQCNENGPRERLRRIILLSCGEETSSQLCTASYYYCVPPADDATGRGQTLLYFGTFVEVL